MRTLIPIMASALLALGGCAASPANQQPRTAQVEPAPAQPGNVRGEAVGTTRGGMGGDMEDACPMKVAGTSVRAEDAADGAALVFTTSGDVAELRQRVARMADMHNRHHSDGSGRMRMRGHTMPGEQQRTPVSGPAPQSGGAMMMPPATAQSQEVEGGARLALTVRDSEQLPALQQHVKRMADMMGSNQCPMMGPAEEQGAATDDDQSGHETHDAPENEKKP